MTSLLQHFNYQGFTKASFSVATLESDCNFTTATKYHAMASQRQRFKVLMPQ